MFHKLNITNLNESANCAFPNASQIGQSLIIRNPSLRMAAALAPVSPSNRALGLQLRKSLWCSQRRSWCGGREVALVKQLPREWTQGPAGLRVLTVHSCVLAQRQRGFVFLVYPCRVLQNPVTSLE